VAVTLYLADRSDTATKLFDFADPSGVNNLGGVKTRLVGIDAGNYTPDMGLFAPDTGDGSFRTRRRAPVTDMTIQLRTTATSQDTHRQAMGRLFSLMEIPRVIVYQGEGMAEAVHIFTLGMTVEQLLRGGQQNWDLIVRQFQDVQMDLTIMRQPIILLATDLDSAVNVLSNPMMVSDQGGADGAVDGTADGWAFRTTAGVLDTVGISGQSTGGVGDGQTFIIATATTKDFTQDVVTGVTAGDVFSGQFVFFADSGITASVAIQYLTGAAVLLGAETVSAPVIGNGKEQRLTVTSAAAPATSAQVRIKLRIQNTSGVSKTVVLRRAQLEEAAAATRFRVSTASVPNDPAVPRGRNLIFWNDGEASVPVRVSVKMDGGSTVQASIIGKRSQFGVTGLRRIGDLQETRYAQTEASQRGWTVTLGVETTNPGGGPDADASGVTANNFVRIAHTTNPATSQKRVTFSRTTKLDSLRGRFKVFGRFRPPTVPKQFAVRMKWSPSLASPAIEDEPEVLIDTYSQTGDAAAPVLVSGFVEVELGSIELPLETDVPLGGLNIEIWSRVVLPTPITAAALDFDFIWLVPADAAGNEDSIGTIYIQGSSAERIVGRNLTSPPFKLAADPVWIAGADQGDAKRMNFQNEAVGWGPNAGGIVLGVGRHRVTFFLTDGLTAVGRNTKVRVTNITDLVETVVNTYTAAKIPKQVVMEWDGVAGKAYQPMVGIITYGGAAGAKGFLDCLSIVYQFVPSVQPNESVRSDPTERYVADRVDASLNLLSVLSASGELPFFADRGMNALSFRQDEIPLQYYIDRQNKDVRSPTVSFIYRPGFYNL